MPDPSAHAPAGAAVDGIVSVREVGPQGMVTLRCDLGDPDIAGAIRSVCGASVPPARGMAKGATATLAWMSPDELLILCAHADAPSMAGALGAALAGRHHLAVDVSDARALFALSGPPGAVRDVLAKSTPADMGPAALPPGEMRRTRLAQASAAIWFEDDADARVACPRSVARYVLDLLAVSAKPGGEVGFFQSRPRRGISPGPGGKG